MSRFFGATAKPYGGRNIGGGGAFGGAGAGAAASFVSSGSVGGNGSIVVPIPASVATDDLLIGVHVKEGTSGTLTRPSGFTLARDDFTGGNPALEAELSYKTATSGDTPGTNQTFTGSFAVDGDAALFAFRGMATTGQFVGSVFTNPSAGTSFPVDASSIVPSDDAIVIYFAFTPSSPATWTEPSGFTPVHNSFNQVGVYAAWKQVSAGALGTYTGTTNVSCQPLLLVASFLCA